MALCVSIANAGTCSSPPSGTASVVTETASFSGFSTSRMYKIVNGPVNNMLYSLMYVSTSDNAVVRKTDTSGVQSWIASFAFLPIAKSLAIDSTEQNVFIASKTTPMIVLRISASTGAVTEQNS